MVLSIFDDGMKANYNISGEIFILSSLNDGTHNRKSIFSFVDIRDRRLRDEKITLEYYAVLYDSKPVLFVSRERKFTFNISQK